MNNGIYVICRNDDTLITDYCESWFDLIRFIEKYQGYELYCTMIFSEWYNKLKEWRSDNGEVKVYRP